MDKILLTDTIRTRAQFYAAVAEHGAVGSAGGVGQAPGNLDALIDWLRECGTHTIIAADLRLPEAEEQALSAALSENGVVLYR